MSVTMDHLKGRTNGLNILFPGTTEYRKSVWTGNRLHWKEKPALVIKATTPEHCEAAIVMARLMKTSITVKNTGHSFAGFSNNEGGILLDVSDMRYATVKWDSETQKAYMTLPAGAVWGDAYKLLADNDLNQFTITGGRCPSVGVCGYTLGGGLGPFTRSYGMGIDMLREVEIVTARDTPVERVIANETENPELFWALRGGGGGNFGVVVSMKFELPILRDSKGMVVTGRFTKKGSIEELTKFIKPLYSTIIKRNRLTIDSTWICTADNGQDEYAIRFTVYFNGNWSKYQTMIGNLFGADSDLVKELLLNTHEELSTSLLEETLEEQWSDEQKKFVSSNNSYHLHSSFVFKNQTTGGTTTMNKVMAKITDLMKQFKELKGMAGTGSSFQCTMIHGGGKARTKKTSDTAFPWRQGDYFGYIFVEWTEKRLHHKETVKDFLQKKCKPALAPLSVDKSASFINFTDRSLEEEKWGSAYYGPNYEKLQKLKEQWDPDGIFRFQQSIKPTSTSGGGGGKNRNGGISYVQVSARSDGAAGEEFGFSAAPQGARGGARVAKVSMMSERAAVFAPFPDQKEADQSDGEGLDDGPSDDEAPVKTMRGPPPGFPRKLQLKGLYRLERNKMW